MNIYTRKKRWKLILLFIAVIIVALSLWYTNVLVRRISENERKNIETWANTIQHKAELVNYTEKFFQQIQEEERKRAEILADAYSNLNMVDENTRSNVLDLYLKIISYNTNIPVILTDKFDTITQARNVDNINFDGVYKLQGELKKEFSEYDPIRIRILEDEYVTLYFKESIIYSELREVLDDLIKSFFTEVARNSASVPVIITDSSRRNVIEYGNIDTLKIRDTAYVQQIVHEMEQENPPIEIELGERGVKYIFYKNSPLLLRLMYYPYIQFGVIGLFLILAYIMFDTARRSEQNQVWVGMSKETAHQLGTPLSSMMAWIELMDMKGIKDEGLDEIKKDVARLQNITERFSKIGSPARLEPVNVVKAIYDGIDYIRSRTSSKVRFRINKPREEEIIVPINIHLFGWVIENLSKNAIDAMGGQGVVKIDISEEERYVNIDFSDTGKGIPKSRFTTIFNPGYTSKKRGWGLGLSLSKRIIKDYHKGKIFVRHSALDKGSTFRISLRKKI
ncbi:MAG: HAMP domain-containing sensor histidine kinase [Bacteroidales bacterium]